MAISTVASSVSSSVDAVAWDSLSKDVDSETKEDGELVSVLPGPSTSHVPFEGIGRSYIANVDEGLGGAAPRSDVGDTFRHTAGTESGF